MFGGGHVVLPLLQAEVVTPGWIDQRAFLTGYGAAQAVPGPLFTFAAYLGAAMGPAPNGVAGAAICARRDVPAGRCCWCSASRRSGMRCARARRPRPRCVAPTPRWSALLGAALYKPVWTSAVLGAADFGLAAGGFLLLTVWKLPPWGVVALLAGAGAASGLL